MNRQGQPPNTGASQQIARMIAAGQLEPAEQQLRMMLRKTPLNGDMWRLLGEVLFIRGQYPQAFDAYQRSFNLRNSAEALAGMAGSAEKLCDFEAAVQCYRALIRLNPKAGEPHYRLAAVLSRQEGKTEEVIQSLERSIGLGWRVRESCLMIGYLAQTLLQNFDLAFNAYQKVLELTPGDPDALIKLAGLHLDVGRVDDAMVLLQRVMAIAPTRSEPYQMAGAALLNQGRHEDSLQMLHRALELTPDDPRAYSGYLFTTNYTDRLPHQQWFEQHLLFNSLVDRLARPATAFGNTPDPARKLRIGFVSADLRHHSVAYFFLPLLQHCDRTQYELVCYYNNLKPDAVTEQMRQLADGWRDVAALGDEELANLIRSDGIDLLVDLGNHSPENRLPVFAWRPAPVQLSWLGYAATTGMRSIDYILTDRYYTPDADAAAFCAEKPAWLNSYRVFRASQAMQVPVAPLPALRNGYLTFGSFNNFTKITAELMLLWVTLLHQIPDARLIIVVQAKESLDYVREFLTSRGIGAERLQVLARLKFDEFLALHGQVDIALDSYPFAGLTTTIHGLWMGVPAITLAGERMLSRSGLSLLAPLGLEEFVAYSPEEYLQRAQYWAGQLPRLAEIRSGLRERLQQSILMDEPGFARDFEACLRQCWQEWCRPQA